MTAKEKTRGKRKEERGKRKEEKGAEGKRNAEHGDVVITKMAKRSQLQRDLPEIVADGRTADLSLSLEQLRGSNICANDLIWPYMRSVLVSWDLFFMLFLCLLLLLKSVESIMDHGDHRLLMGFINVYVNTLSLRNE